MAGSGVPPEDPPVKRRRLRGCLVVVGLAVVAMLALGAILEACGVSGSGDPEPGVSTPSGVESGESFSVPSSPPEPDVEDTLPPQEDEDDRWTPESVPPAPPEPEVSSEVPEGVYYENCDAARAAGAAPLLRGGSGYREELDRDGDGVACELPP
ncbi:excalibur calcium-binding domain-containing protein [Streptomyces sp. NPDC006856]|uniref:excalibur calcium-binding domain-containing protein n=2 Tax=unclassified Streptomyces TaxID=2593676 RepID=UPI00369771B8